MLVRAQVRELKAMIYDYHLTATHLEHITGTVEKTDTV